MSETVVLEWKFSPPDYFESPIEISKDDYTMIIADGKAEAKIDSAIYKANPSIRDELHDELTALFLAGMLFSHREYHLSGSMICIHPDGRKDYVMKCDPCHLKLTGHTIDFQKCDKDGNIVVDTMQDRIDKRSHIGDLVGRHLAYDDVLKSMLNSFEAAVKDPDNELVHLYEIRDCLVHKFGKKSKKSGAQLVLGISDSDWNGIGKPANNPSVRQGRHCSQRGGAIRDATDDELFKARSSARKMIEAYLRYLDETADSSGPQ